MFHKILVPLDGSLEAEQALQPALELARAFQAELHLISVEQLPDQPTPSEWELTLGRYMDTKRDETQAYLNGLVARCNGLQVTTSVLPLGSPALRISQEACEEKADLIVLFSHGRSGLSRFFLGSVAERLARKSPCPVMLVHPSKGGQETLPKSDG